MTVFDDARAAPRRLSYLASFNEQQRRYVERPPSLRAAIGNAPLERWQGLVEAYRARRRRPADATRPVAPKQQSAIRRKALRLMKGLADDYAQLDDGRNEVLFQMICRLGKYVTHGYLERDELDLCFRSAAEANGALRARGDRWFDEMIERCLAYARNDADPQIASYRERER